MGNYHSQRSLSGTENHRPDEEGPERPGIHQHQFDRFQGHAEVHRPHGCGETRGNSRGESGGTEGRRQDARTDRLYSRHGLQTGNSERDRGLLQWRTSRRQREQDDVKGFDEESIGTESERRGEGCLQDVHDEQHGRYQEVSWYGRRSQRAGEYRRRQ